MAENLGRIGDLTLPQRRSGRLGRILRGFALVAVGALGAAALLSGRGIEGVTSPSSARLPIPAGAPAAPAPPAPSTAAQAPAEIEVSLPAETISRAGIKTAQVGAVESTKAVQVPGIVTPNNYKDVKVVPIAGGIVIQVAVELGRAVKRGEPLATLFSNELAEAQAKYLSMAAMAGAEKLKLERVRQLAGIGAASRQELEESTATRESRETEVEAARQRLLLLGLTRAHVERLKSPSQIVSQVAVPAPIDGVIISRAANLGQVVGMGQEMFTVTDLSDVWVVADIYEQDFAAVQIGSEATLTSQAYPGLSIRGRVSYIDPRVDPQTRTAKVRVEVPNPGGRLRLGMYMAVAFRTANGEKVTVIPQAAVQAVGDRQVVFLPVKGEEGKYVQRVVQLGHLVGDSYAVLSGLRPGDTVVTEGSFFLRAESARMASSN